MLSVIDGDGTLGGGEECGVDGIRRHEDEGDETEAGGDAAFDDEDPSVMCE